MKLVKRYKKDTGSLQSVFSIRKKYEKRIARLGEMMKSTGCFESYYRNSGMLNWKFTFAKFWILCIQERSKEDFKLIEEELLIDGSNTSLSVYIFA